MWKLLISVAFACLCTQTTAQGFSQTALKLLDTISSRIFEIGISSARAFAQVTYDDVRLDTHLDTFFVSGLKIIPFTSDSLNGCEINIGAIDISSKRKESKNSEYFLIGLSDVYITKRCLPFETRSILAIAGIDNIDIPLVRMEVEHEYSTAATNFQVYGKVEDAVGFTASAKFNYLSASQSTYHPVVANLQSINVTLENFGIWEKISNQLPSQFIQPSIAGVTVSLLVSEELSKILNHNSNANISSQVGTAIDEFITNPGSLSVFTEIADNDGLMLNLNTLDDIDYLINKLNLRILSNSKKLLFEMSNEDLAKVLGGKFSTFDIGKLFEIANALKDGVGAPKNPSLAVKVYKYLAELDYKKAYENLINLYLERGNFSEAYLTAQNLGISGKGNARVYFNIIEKNLSLIEIINLQKQPINSVERQQVDKKNPYETARNYFTGNGTPKKYDEAYFWALIAQTNGDGRSGLIIEKIETLTRKLTKTQAVEWAGRLEQIQLEAMEYWRHQKGSDKL